MDIKYDGALKMKCFNDFLLSKVVLFPTFARAKGEALVNNTCKQKK